MNTENLARKLGMEQKTYCSADGGTLNYCIRKTGDLQSREKAAVMMFLHGAGERGDDNHRAARALRIGSRGILRDGTQESHPAVSAVSGESDVDSCPLVAAGTYDEPGADSAIETRD